MGIFNLQLRRKQPDQETRGYLQGCVNTADAALSYSDIFKTGYNSLYIAAFHRCVDLISSTLAQLPIKVRIKDREHISEMESHPVLEAFADKNNPLTPFMMVKNVVRDVITKGNGFIHIKRGTDGSVTGLRYVEPGDVSIFYDKDQNKLYYTIPVLTKNTRIEPVNMLHFRMWSFDGVNGVGIAKYMKNTLMLANDIDEATRSFYSNNMNLNGVLSAKQPVSEKQLAQIKQAWNTTYNSKGGVVVLPSTLEYQSIQSDNAQGATSAKEASAIEICTWLGVSPILIGILTHSSGYSFEQARLEFLSNTIMAWVQMMEQEMNRKLLKPSEANLTVDLDETAMLKADKQTLMQYYTGLISSGVLCINEARKELNYNPIEGGDKHIIPFTDISQNNISNQDTTEQ